MNLVDKQVVHKSFGKGSVVEQDDSYIEISFAHGNKIFVFPDVFETHLTLKDQRAANLVKEMIQKRKKELRKEEMKLLKAEALIREEQRLTLEHKRLSKSHKDHHSLQAVFWCEDEEKDKIFIDWHIFTGEIKSGSKKGQPNLLVRMNRNSACLLTERQLDVPEKERSILGVYMVKETFIGRLCEDGYIPAHTDYRLRLSEEESKKMLFWNYYLNEKYPDKITWNTGRYRYFENITMAQILRDIASLKRSPDEKELAQRFLKHFCLLNNIDEENLPKNNGALLRI